ncbi:MAG: DNA primase [Candidatus Aenigmarchaeota archaeon]|nr:DNA primase [Candidatus Aenigmarchaeota archaeon]
MIEVEFTTDATVEKPDVIGAIFGQTEGLLGQDLDLRELQRTGRIGRIDVEVEAIEGKTSGKFYVPSSLDSSETALVAAAFETIERIGPSNAKVKVSVVKDVRVMKRDFMIGRAKDILQNLIGVEQPSATAITEQIKEDVRTAQILDFMGLPSGPDVQTSDEVILVEGRADVLNLLKNGINNAIAIGGTTIPGAVVNLSKEKITTLFVDGDRGGDLIIKEALQLCDIDYIVRAPTEKEVEDLTKKEIFKALREKIDAQLLKTEVKTKELKEFIRRNAAPQASEKSETTE